MAEIKSFPNNQDEYVGAEYVMKWFHGRTSGVFGANNNAAVAALASPAMAVTVSDGVGWISNSNADGVVWWNDNEVTNTAKLQLTIDVADGVLNRIDRVIVEWSTTNYVERPQIRILKGSNASNPSAPSLTNNSTVRQLSLARISIPAGTTAITASMITDERLNSAVCGLVTEAVSVDTSTMQAQFTEFLEGISRELADLENNVYASRVVSYKIALPVSGWADKQQTVTVTALTADETKTDVIASPDPADNENREAYMDYDVYIVKQMDGAAVFACDSVPNRELTVNISVIIKGQTPSGASYPDGDEVAYG